MAQFGFDSSSCQVEGEIVPVVEINLAPTDAVYFEHHVLLWKEDSVPLVVMQQQGPKRSLFSLPHIISIARGPAASRSRAIRPARSSCCRCIPAGGRRPRARVPARERAVSYSYVRIQGLANILYGGNGMWLDRFVTQQAPGLLVLHGYGNVFERTLAPGESIQLEPGAMLFKDASVTLATEKIMLCKGIFGGNSMYLARLTGPGRIGIQSMYHHHASGE